MASENSSPSDHLHAPASDQSLTPQIGRTGMAPRPAWVEVDAARLKRNLELLRAELPRGLRWLAVVKDNAYGHGLLTVAQAAVSAGASFLGISTVEEGVQLRQAGINAPLLVLGERHPDELPFCLQHQLRVSVGALSTARLLNELALESGSCVPVHLKINTGMNRFGVHWTEAASVAAALRTLPGLVLEGVMSHFSMSDEADKTFAQEQLRRFNDALNALTQAGIRPGLRHMCNTGGYLDLPAAHFDLVRLGILPLGVFPSAVCRRIPGLAPVLSVKARLVAVRQLATGDVYGYGLRYRATEPRRIGVLPIGYGDGYPRLRNTGHVLVRGQRAPIIGGVSMDALGIDLTGIPEATLWDEAVLLGQQGEQTITAHDIAGWANTVSYHILTGWRARLPRLTIE